MRKLKIILIHVIALLSSFGCKPDFNNIEYRDQYVGSFNFSSYSYFYDYMKDTTYYLDTIAFNGTIDIDNEKNNIIIIKYRPPGSSGCSLGDLKVYGSEVTPTLDNKGNLSFPNSPQYWHASLSGQFYGTDSLRFGVRCESAGATWGHVVSGKRK